jgi:adenylate kinase
MRLILLGPPGCGKGTQAQKLSRNFGLEHISTGNLLREAIGARTSAGVRAQPFLEKGQLVPDELVNEMVAERFTRPLPGFLLDGYPRTRGQAEAFQATLNRANLTLTAVMFLVVDDEEILRRVTGRRSCPRPGCGATYHVEFAPPRKEGICDRDGTPLIQREDDTPETLRARLQVFHNNTVGLLAYYADLGLLREVNGKGDIENVYQEILKALETQAKETC